MSGLSLPLLITGLLAALLLAILLWEALTILRARVPSQVRLTQVGAQAPACDAEIPPIVWTYWHTESLPAFVEACLANWHRHAPDHEIRLLSRASVQGWLKHLPPNFDALPAYRQADWVRIHLLAQYGGIWMDASILLCRDLAWVHALRRQHQAEYVGFFIDRYTTRPELPLIENWFMASVPGARFAQGLAHRFDQVLAQGAEQLLDELKAQRRHTQVVQNLTEDFQRYLLMHVAAADLLDREPQAYRLTLQRAEDGPYAWLQAVGWRKRHHYARLALTLCPKRLPALIKLRGGDRALAERLWLRGRWVKRSALIRLIGTPNDHHTTH